MYHMSIETLHKQAQCWMQGKTFEGRYDPPPDQLAAFLENQDDVTLDGELRNRGYPKTSQPLSASAPYLDEDPDGEEIAQYVRDVFNETDVDTHYVDVADGGDRKEFSAHLRYTLDPSKHHINRGEACITGTADDVPFDRYVPDEETGTYDMPVDGASTLIEHTDQIDTEIPLYVYSPQLYGRTEELVEPTHSSGTGYDGEEAAQMFDWIADNRSITTPVLQTSQNTRDYTLSFDVDVPLDWDDEWYLTEPITFHGTLPLIYGDSVDETLEQLGCTVHTDS